MIEMKYYACLNLNTITHSIADQNTGYSILPIDITLYQYGLISKRCKTSSIPIIHILPWGNPQETSRKLTKSTDTNGKSMKQYYW